MISKKTCFLLLLLSAMHESHAMQDQVTLTRVGSITDLSAKSPASSVASPAKTSTMTSSVTTPAKKTVLETVSIVLDNQNKTAEPATPSSRTSFSEAASLESDSPAEEVVKAQTSAIVSTASSAVQSATSSVLQSTSLAHNQHNASDDLRKKISRDEAYIEYGAQLDEALEYADYFLLPNILAELKRAQVSFVVEGEPDFFDRGVKLILEILSKKTDTTKEEKCRMDEREADRLMNIPLSVALQQADPIALEACISEIKRYRKSHIVVRKFGDKELVDERYFIENLNNAYIGRRALERAKKLLETTQGCNTLIRAESPQSNLYVEAVQRLAEKVRAKHVELFQQQQKVMELEEQKRLFEEDIERKKSYLDDLTKRLLAANTRLKRNHRDPLLEEQEEQLFKEWFLIALPQAPKQPVKQESSFCSLV